MYVILKTSLNKEGINILNDNHCDGVEIQLLNQSDDFSLLKTINKRIVSIHIDLFDDNWTFEGNEKLDLFKIITTDYLYNYLIGKVIPNAVAHNAGIVVHALYSVDVIRKSRLFRKRLQAIFNEYPSIRFYVENPGCIPLSETKDTFMRTSRLPEYCKFINEQIFKGNEVCFPLIDICHYYMERSGEVDFKEEDTLGDMIRKCKSKYQFFHFNYGIGDCAKGRHSLNFNTNKKLLVNLLQFINSVNPNAYLVLEIEEENYTTRENMLTLLNDISELTSYNKE